MRECLKVTPVDLLNWYPRDGRPTFGQLYERISITINGWLTEVFRDSGQTRLANDAGGNEKQRLDHLLAFSFERLEHFLGYVDLAKMYDSGGKSLRGAWIVIRMFRHDIHHCAELMVYLRQNGIEPPNAA